MLHKLPRGECVLLFLFQYTGQWPMFSHLDAAFRSPRTDQGALLKMLALEGVGSRHFGEIPVRVGGCQGANAAFLTMLHRQQCAATDGQHLLLLQKGLSLGVLMLSLLSPLIVMRLTSGGNLLEVSAWAHTTPALLRYRGRGRKKLGSIS